MRRQNVKIYVININDYEDDLSLCLKYLSINETLDVLKFKFTADRCRKAVAILLSKFLVNGQKYEYADTIKRNEHGKPISKINNKYFNISHAGKMVAGIVADGQVGIDCEEQKADRFNIEIANKFFHKSEVEFLLLNDNFKAQLNKFYYIWTRKEAVVKGDGGGLTIPLNSFSVLTNNKIIINDRQWFVVTLENLDFNYSLSYSSSSFGTYCNIVKCNVSNFILETYGTVKIS